MRGVIGVDERLGDFALTDNREVSIATQTRFPIERNSRLLLLRLQSATEVLRIRVIAEKSTFQKVHLFDSLRWFIPVVQLHEALVRLSVNEHEFLSYGQ